MNILVVLPNLNIGGAQRVALDVAKLLHAKGDFVAVCAAGSEGAFRSEVEPLKLYEQKLGLRLVSLWKFIVLLRKAIDEHRPDALIVHLRAMNSFVLLLRMVGLVQTPTIVVEHSEFLSGKTRTRASCFRHVVRKWAYRRLHSSADAVIGVSSAVTNSVRRQMRKTGRVVWIQNGIDIEKIDKHINVCTKNRQFVENFERPLIVAVGRLVREKGFDVLLEAFARVRLDFSLANLVIIGDGPARRSLEVQAGRLAISGSVHFLGADSNPWAVMSRADVFVLSSRSEGFGLVVAEAVACGLPVVSTDCKSGPAEILEGNCRSRIVPVECPAAMADAVRDLLGNECSASPGSLAPQFSVDVMAARYRDVVASVVDSRPVAGHSKRPLIRRLHL